LITRRGKCQGKGVSPTTFPRLRKGGSESKNKKMKMTSGDRLSSCLRGQVRLRRGGTKKKGPKKKSFSRIRGSLVPRGGPALFRKERSKSDLGKSPPTENWKELLPIHKNK